MFTRWEYSSMVERDLRVIGRAGSPICWIRWRSRWASLSVV